MTNFEFKPQGRGTAERGLTHEVMIINQKRGTVVRFRNDAIMKLGIKRGSRLSIRYLDGQLCMGKSNDPTDFNVRSYTSESYTPIITSKSLATIAGCYDLQYHNTQYYTMVKQQS